MNKKEFIEKLKGHGAWCTECHDINGEKDRYVKVAKVRELLEQLDEPQKVTVPECVGELLDYYRNSTDVDLLALLITFKDWYRRKDKAGENENAIDWLVKHPEKYMRAWLDGYEVEESKWVVKRADSDYVTSFNQSLLNTNIDVTSSLDCVSYYKFTDLKKAEAVATLVDGSVEEV